MAITIDGTNGVTLPDGTAANPATKGTTSPNSAGLFYPAANTVAISTSGSERVRIDSSGNVGVGTNSPAYNFHLKNASGNAYIATQYGTGTIGYMLAASNEVQFKAFNGTNDVMTFATGASERMRIDSSGRVTMPYQPYAQGSSGNGYTLASAGFVNGFVVIYNNVDYNVGSHYNNTNGRFTAPVAGVYLVCYTILISTSSSSSVDYRLSISINGNQSQTFSSTKSNGWPTVGGSQMVYLNAGDYVAAKFWNDSGSGTMHPDANYNRFSITLMG